MRRAFGTHLSRVLFVLALAVGGAAAKDPPAKSAAEVRATRRAYDGAPPVIAHQTFNAECVSCHNRGGIEVPGVGFAPPMPHELTGGMSAISRCEQCHVWQRSTTEMVASRFEGLSQDLRRGPRLGEGSPPVIPHSVFMRENCAACHAGLAAREAIRTSHPRRERCQQCHVSAVTAEVFAR